MLTYFSKIFRYQICKSFGRDLVYVRSPVVKIRITDLRSDTLLQYKQGDMNLQTHRAANPTESR